MIFRTQRVEMAGDKMPGFRNDDIGGVEKS